MHIENDGTETLILITKATFYTWNGTAWIYPSDGTKTTVNGAQAPAETVIETAATAGFTAADFIGITLDDGTQHQTTIDSVQAGVSLTIDDGLPSAAGDGKAVVKAVDLVGSDASQVIAVPVVFNDWTAFTNGIDKPMYYDSTDVLLIAGLPSGGDIVCRAMAIANGSFVLGNLKEAGVANVRKVLWSDTADLTEWAAGNAGNQVLHGSRDPIQAIKPLGPDVFVYGTRSVVRMEALGTADFTFSFVPTIFGEAVSSAGVGAVSQSAVFAVGDRHIIMTQAGVFSYTGGFTAEQLAIPKVFRKFFDSTGEISESKQDRNFVHYIDGQDEMFFFYVLEGNEFPDRALVVDLSKGVWRKRVFAHQFTFADTMTDVSVTRIIDLVGDIASQNYPIKSPALGSSVKTTILGSADTASKVVYQYNFIAADDAGTAIAWDITSKTFLWLDKEHRVDWFEMDISGDSVTFAVSIDGGKTFTLSTMLSPGAAPVLTRTQDKIDQFVANSITMKWSGTGGFSLGPVSMRHKEESRWSL
jgi:hypothetical protein